MNHNPKDLINLGYFQFPYLIIREMCGIYRQVPIHFNSLNVSNKEGLIIHLLGNETHEEIQDKCVESLRKMITSRSVVTVQRESKKKWLFSGLQNKEGCAVFNPSFAIYLSSNGELKRKSKSIPSGGTLLSMCDETLSMNEPHFTL
ncbi:MAG: hypothetical protein RLZZ337_1103 [Bacteroidota bacterium]|jgi:hypothetical protein